MIYYDREGRMISTTKWAEKFSDHDYQILKKSTVWEVDEFCPIIEVSTVWLGIDHNYSLDGPPLIFETMVFGNISMDNECWRWSTESEAIVGHEAVVKIVREFFHKDGTWQETKLEQCLKGWQK